MENGSTSCNGPENFKIETDTQSRSSKSISCHLIYHTYLQLFWTIISIAMSLKLDSNGNIDTRILESELRDALEFDIRYRQTDNMKKKAVKVATNYDEFKNMVACAHLKTLR